MKIKVVVVDDNYSALTAIKNYCEQLNLQVVDAFDSPQKFLDSLGNMSFDIAILDYEMPKYNGIELAELLNSKSIPVIFVTGHREVIAAKAWDLNCIACIEKPVNTEKIKTAIQKYSDLKINNISEEKLELKIYGDAIAIIKISDIAFITSCEADSGGNDRYLQTFSNKGYRVVNKKVEDLIKVLPSDNFMRISRSDIISKNAIDSYSQNFEEVKLSVHTNEKNICMNKTTSSFISFNVSPKIKNDFKLWMENK